MYRIIIIILVCLFALLSSGGFNTELKLVGLVLLAFLVSSLQIRGVRIPKGLILISVIFGFIAYSYSETIRNKRIVLVELQGDKDFKKSSRFIGYLPRSQAWYQKINSYAELSELHSKNPQAAVMLWGKDKFLVLSLGEMKKNKIEGFNFIERVPFVGLNKIDGCHRFINSLAKGIADNSIEDLENAFGIRYHWTSQAHRAYPLFLLGNERVRAGLFDDKTKSLFEKAVNYIRPHENPNLRGAIMNNLAIVYIKTGQSKEQIVGAFKHGIRSIHERSPFGEELFAGRIAKNNLKKFKKAQKSEKHNRKD